MAIPPVSTEEMLRQMDNLCPPRKNICNECPWTRDSIQGWLGPHDADYWLQVVHGESPIACHQTIPFDDPPWDYPQLRQCAGAAVYRANVCKLPVFPKVAVGPEDHETVFSSPQEFMEHHSRNGSALNH